MEARGMSTQDLLNLAEPLRKYLVEHLPPALLPVKPGQFSVDGLLENGASMSLQINGGEVERTYLDGTRKMRLNFTIFYRNPNGAKNNAVKSNMMAILNGWGEWMQGLREMPYLGDWLNVSSLEQVQLANIAQADTPTMQNITYQAVFTLGYSTKITN
jgi:hypothetical protein